MKPFIYIFSCIFSSDWKHETAFLIDLTGIAVLTQAALKSHRAELHQDGFWEVERLDEQHSPHNWYSRATASMFSRYGKRDMVSRSEGGNKPRGVLLTLGTPKK